jgi:hypothetical protein
MASSLEVARKFGPMNRTSGNRDAQPRYLYRRRLAEHPNVNLGRDAATNAQGDAPLVATLVLSTSSEGLMFVRNPTKWVRNVPSS